MTYAYELEDRVSELTRERDEAREIAYSARRIADKHAAAAPELRAMVKRLANRVDLECTSRQAESDVVEARVLLERTGP